MRGVRPLAAFVMSLAVLVLLSVTGPVSAFEPEYPRYQVSLGRPATTVGEAVNGLADRRRRVINWNTCGDEMGFLANEGARNKENKRTSDTLPTVLGKVAFLNDNPEQDCIGTVTYFGWEIDGWHNWPKPEDNGGKNHEDGELKNMPLANDFEANGQKAINDAFQRRFGDTCKSIVAAVRKALDRNDFEIEYIVSHECLKEQVNRALVVREKVGNSGTSGLPCRILDTAGEGDWDMAVIGFIRILHYDKLHGGRALTTPTRDKVIADLLTMSGDLEPESYGLFQCGNREHDTGSPQDRADERAFYNDGNFFDDLGDLFSWFVNFLIIALPVALALLALLTWLGASAAAIIAALTAAGGVLVAAHQFRVPETENHLLMINSSKYLTNQLIIEALPDAEDRENFIDDNEELREWFLQRLARITREDFIEYNSKPYQRLSIAAILNMFDFVPAEEEKLRKGARIVLDFASAKFAAGSNQARRIVPFRRLMETNRHEIWGPGIDGLKPRRVFDFGSGSDHQTAAMLYFTGLTGQLPLETIGVGELAQKNWLATSAIVNEMIWEATSNYKPNEIILDVAINKSAPYEQRIHHEGFEIYSSGPGYLITAGGIQTDFAYGALLTPLQISTDVPFNFKLKNEDRGAGVPTTLIPAATALQHRREDFLRFDGPLREWSHGDRDTDQASNAECETNPEKAGKAFCKRNLTNDHNLCVHRGFACGINLAVPPAIAACIKAPRSSDPAWGFIESETCEPYKGAPPFYVVLLRRPCPAADEDCQTQWGLFEAVDKPAGMTFDQFMTQTIVRNPLALFSLPASMVGTYRSWRDETIAYNVEAHQDDDDESGISGIDNLDQRDIDEWELAEGDVIEADGDGRMTILAPSRQEISGIKNRIEIDFTDWDDPKYEERP